MSLSERYWKTVFYTFLQYFSILMFLSGIGFIIAGKVVNAWFYMGLFSWPLLIMLGVVNLKYIRLLAKENRLI